MKYLVRRVPLSGSKTKSTFLTLFCDSFDGSRKTHLHSKDDIDLLSCFRRRVKGTRSHFLLFRRSDSTGTFFQGSVYLWGTHTSPFLLSTHLYHLFQSFLSFMGKRFLLYFDYLFLYSFTSRSDRWFIYFQFYCCVTKNEQFNRV